LGVMDLISATKASRTSVASALSASYFCTKVLPAQRGAWVF
jgi:hypothetical protein